MISISPMISTMGDEMVSTTSDEIVSTMGDEIVLTMGYRMYKPFALLNFAIQIFLLATLPIPFLESLQGLSGFDADNFVQAHEAAEQVVSVRLNASKWFGRDMLPLSSIAGDAVPWCNDGYYLKERPLFTTDPLFHAGAYYVQEASSMFVEQAMRQCVDLQQKIYVLDLCAAPGGKSTLLQSLISDESLLVSNEVIKSRVSILAENITKWGAANVVVSSNDPKDFARLPGFFDCVLVDAPCSGSGLFRKDVAAMQEWSLQNVALCSERQQRIIADVWPALKPGGICIYSTCSYSLAEDEAIADWLMDTYEAESIRLSLRSNWGVVETVSAKHTCYGYRFYPDKVKGEGFFISVFKKMGSSTYCYSEAKQVKTTALSKTEESIAAQWLKQPQDFKWMKWQSDVLALPAAIYDDVRLLQQYLYLRKAGINIGSIIRDELIPSHEGIMSTAYANKLPTIEVDLPTALDYLRRNDIKPDTPYKGWAVIHYLGIALGLVKLLPNRVNNYYPKEWRILNK